MSSTEPRVIEYSLDGGMTWHHGRTIDAWAALDRATLAGQREATREHAREWHGNVESVTTRMLMRDDPRGMLNQPVRPDLATAARNALPALVLLGDYIGNTFEGKTGIPAFDRCKLILDLKDVLGII